MIPPENLLACADIVIFGECVALDLRWRSKPFGLFHGVTRPYQTDACPHFAANEPAKPPESLR